MRGVSRWIALAPIAALALGACDKGAGRGFATFRDSASYAIGISMGTSVREVRDSVNLELLVVGLRDAADSNDRRLTDEDIGRVLRRFSERAEAALSERAAIQAQENVMQGDTYRAENAKRPGVTTTASGLQYEVLTPGTGPTPSATDEVTVHYRGAFIDGREFDSSYDRGEPATFLANRVIAGWTEGLQLMQVGGKYRLVIPPELGYGEQGAGPIGPNQTLVFEVELLRIGR